jgi:hypothetical protein
MKEKEVERGWCENKCSLVEPRPKKGRAIVKAKFTLDHLSLKHPDAWTMAVVSWLLYWTLQAGKPASEKAPSTPPSSPLLAVLSGETQPGPTQ